VKFFDNIRLVDVHARMILKAEASRFYLSFLWWIFEPLMIVLGFYFVFNYLLQQGQENYLLFLLCAKVPFVWFSKAVTAASGSIIGQKGIISQLNIAKAIFPYTAIQVSLYKELPVLLLLFITCMAFGFFPTQQWLWLIPLILVEYMIIVAVSLAAALVICYVEDVRILINMVMLLLMFCSGIFFDISSLTPPIGDYLLMYNPIAFMCDSFRLILMQKGMYSLDHLALLGIIFSLLIVLMHLIYARLNQHIAARVINS
jgi:lipopolysaccharide transport system permease protein